MHVMIQVEALTNKDIKFCLYQNLNSLLFFEHEEVEKPLRMPELIGLINTSKRRENWNLLETEYFKLVFVSWILSAFTISLQLGGDTNSDRKWYTQYNFNECD